MMTEPHPKSQLHFLLPSNTPYALHVCSTSFNKKVNSAWYFQQKYHGVKKSTTCKYPKSGDQVLQLQNVTYCEKHDLLKGKKPNPSKMSPICHKFVFFSLFFSWKAEEVLQAQYREKKLHDGRDYHVTNTVLGVLSLWHLPW